MSRHKGKGGRTGAKFAQAAGYKSKPALDYTPADVEAARALVQRDRAVVALADGSVEGEIPLAKDTEAALKRLHSDPVTALTIATGMPMLDMGKAPISAQAKATLNMLKTKPGAINADSIMPGQKIKSPTTGANYTNLDMDAQVDLSPGKDGKPKAFTLVSKADVEEFGPARAVANVESYQKLVRDVEALAKTVSTQRPEDMPTERIAMAGKNSMHTLLGADMMLRPVMMKAKSFHLDIETLKAAKALADTPPEEWLKDVVVPFPVTLLTLGATVVTMDEYEGQWAIRTGALIVGRQIFPAWDNGFRGSLYPARVRLPGWKPEDDEPLSHMIALGHDRDQNIPNPETLWWSDHPIPEGMEIVGNLKLARQWLESTSDGETALHHLGVAIVSSLQNNARHVAAALAYINRQRDRVEWTPSEREGRTFVKVGTKAESVPRYTTGFIRLKPEAPMVVGRPEPDPNREIIKRVEHDVRAHKRTYYRGTEKEFTIDVDAHKRGDPELGKSDKSYVVGEAPASEIVSRAVERIVDPICEGPIPVDTSTIQIEGRPLAEVVAELSPAVQEGKPGWRKRLGAIVKRLLSRG